MRRAFICHNSQDSKFVIEVCRFLKQSLDDVFYYEDYQRKPENLRKGFLEQIANAINEFEVFIAFFGYDITEWQNDEMTILIQYQNDTSNIEKKEVIVVLYGRDNLPEGTAKFLGKHEYIKVPNVSKQDTDAYKLAKDIVRRLKLNWKSKDGLPPVSDYFQYEKDIIKDYINLRVFGDKLYSADTEKKDTIHWCFNLLGLREKMGLTEAEFNDLVKNYLESPEILKELKLSEEDSVRLLKSHFNENEQDAKIEYKKADIVKKFSETQGKIEEIRLDLREKLINGLPPVWPDVKKMPDESIYHKNTVDKRILGEFRPDKARVVAAALNSFHPHSETCLYKKQLTFPEAGPREYLFYPRGRRNLRVAILVSGGIAPGINSVINGITQRHELYARESQKPYLVEVIGLRNGFYAFDNYSSSHITLTAFNKALGNSIYTPSVANENGSCIGTSRDERLIDHSPDEDQCEIIIDQLLTDHIDILYIIGGDGSMRAAHALWNYSKEMIRLGRYRDRNISIIGIPKTMDNDILWVWQTFGFLSAVEKAREIIEQLSAEVMSNPRICIVQLFGSDSGFVVSHAVVASKSTVCDVALIPEVNFTMRKLADYIAETIEEKRKEAKIPMSLIVMAETAIPKDALEYIVDDKLGLTEEEIGTRLALPRKEIEAITSFINSKQLVSINKRDDILRTTGLKIVSQVLNNLLPGQDSGSISWSRKRVFTIEPRHLLRTTDPSCSDTIMGHRLGTLAVDNALAGYNDFMISQWLTEYVLVPLKLVVLGKKRIPTNGIFWKSVTAKTGQPDLEEKKKSGDIEN